MSMMASATPSSGRARTARRRSIYYYDADGNLSSKTDADSHTTYDALDRPLVTTVTGDSTLTVTNTYDQTGHGDGIGRLTSVTDHAGSLSLSYDEHGNVLTNARTIFGTTYTTTYAYDGASRISSIVYPSAGTTGWTVGYTRSISGYVTGITATPPGGSPSTIASSIVFYPFGPLSSLTWGNGVTGSDSRDQDYRLTHLTDTAASAIVNLTYGNDADSNLHTVSDALNAANSQTLTYDELERLTGAVSGTGGYGTLSYTYDNNGNRKTDTGTSYTYLSTGNVPTKVGTTTYLHTSTGNIKGGFLGIGAE